MIRKFLSGLMLLCAFSLFAEEDVLFTVGKERMTVGEFLYLYNKNAKPAGISPDKYLEDYITVKRKVCDAKAMGLDTTAVFKKDISNYRFKLQKKYQAADTLLERYVCEAYARMQSEREVSYIALGSKGSRKSDAGVIATLDSLRRLALAGGDFAELAKKHSQEPNTRRRGGYAGFVVSGATPVEFEETAYATPVGGISDVVMSDYTYYIIKVHSERPARGEVLVKHILKLYPDSAGETEKAQVKAKVDSIYKVLLAGAEFEDVAKLESEDPGSKDKGGELGWFGTGRMVPEFEKVSYSLNDGELSEPFETVYGVHVVKKYGSRGVPALEEVRGELEFGVRSDSRSMRISEERLKILTERYGVQSHLEPFLLQVGELFDSCAYGSELIERISAMDAVLYTYADGLTVKSSEVVKRMHAKSRLNRNSTIQYVRNIASDLISLHLIVQDGKNTMAETLKNNPEYRYELGEYADFSAVFAVTDKLVYSAGAEDVQKAVESKWLKRLAREYSVKIDKKSLKKVKNKLK